MPAHRTDKSAHLNEMGNHYNPTTLCETSFPSYTRQDIPMHSTKERTKRIQLPDSARDTVQNNSTMPLHRKSGITGPTKNPRLINCFSLYKEQTVDSHSHPKKLYTKKLKTIVQLHIIICFFSVFFFVSLLLFPRRHIFYLLSRQSMPPLSVVVQSLMETYALR